MSRFNGEDLFGSGPHEFIVHGVAQRHVRHEQPGADGVRVSVMGRTGRTIEQLGTLLADTVDALQSQLAAIEAAMSGEAAELVDHLGRTWPSVLMLEFKPGRVRRIGVRLGVDYRALYMQVQP